MTIRKDSFNIIAPMVDEQILNLKAGNVVSISGYLYTARDSAHKIFYKCIQEGKELPLKLNGQVLFYAGPTPAKPGYSFGSIGPTSSYRMDLYTPLLLENGLKGMIGKGLRSKEVVESIKKNKAIYFVVVGGAAAFIGRSVTECTEIEFPELVGETIYKLKVNHFEAVVAIDAYGGNLIESEISKYHRVI